jgi:hypothetical protein
MRALQAQRVKEHKERMIQCELRDVLRELNAYLCGEPGAPSIRIKIRNAGVINELIKSGYTVVQDEADKNMWVVSWEAVDEEEEEEECTCLTQGPMGWEGDAPPPVHGPACTRKW